MAFLENFSILLVFKNILLYKRAIFKYIILLEVVCDIYVWLPKFKTCEKFVGFIALKKLI